MCTTPSFEHTHSCSATKIGKEALTAPQKPSCFFIWSLTTFPHKITTSLICMILNSLFLPFMTPAPWKKRKLPAVFQPRQHIKKQRHYFANKGPSSQSYGFFSGHVWMWELDHKESWAPKYSWFWTVVLEKTLESLGLQGNRTSQSGKKSVLNIHRKDCCWSWHSNTLVTWFEEPTQWIRPWCWERLRAGGEGGDRGWDGWMASPTQWTWIWADYRRSWRTGEPGLLQSMGSRRVGHNLAAE